MCGQTAKAARHGDGREVIVDRNGNRVPLVWNISEGAKSAIEAPLIVSSNLTMRTIWLLYGSVDN